MFEIPVLPVHGGFHLTVISRGFWEGGMTVVCSLKDLKRESKSRGYTGSCPAQCLTAGSFRTESYGPLNLEATLNCGNVWVGSPPGGLPPPPPLAEVLEYPLKYSCSSFEQTSKSLLVWSYSQMFILWVSGPFSSQRCTLRVAIGVFDELGWS